MRLGECVRLVDYLVVVGVAVVHISSGIIQVDFFRNTFLLAAEEFAHPALGEILAGVHSGRLRAHIVVVGVPEQAGVHITVVHDVGEVGRLEEREVGVVVESEFTRFPGSILGGDEHDAEGRARTIYGSRCCIFQHRNAFDVVRVQQRRVAFHSVDEDEGASAATDGGRTADVIIGRAARLTVGQRDVEVRDGSHQHLRGVGRRASGEDFGGHLVHCAGKVGAFHAAITHDDHVV